MIMDFTTTIGMLIGAALLLYGMGLNNLGAFFDPQSLAITLGGTIAVIFASVPLKTLLSIPKHVMITMGIGTKYKPLKIIDDMVELAQLARRSGLLALEEQANAQTDPFMKTSLLLIVDAVDADKIRHMLETDLNYLHARHGEGIGMYEKGVALSPAFGMLGTLIGLILMLGNLGDSSSGGGAGDIGAGMSTALITTFYGSLFANLIFTPMANKLKVRHEEEMVCKEIIIEGVLSIQSGENPKYIREKLVAFLPQKFRAEKPGKGGDAAE